MPDSTPFCHQKFIFCEMDCQLEVIFELYSPVKKTRMNWNLILKIFSLLILVVQALHLMNPTNATLAKLSVLKY